MKAIPITKDQAACLLDIARAVVIDDMGVCFHNIYWDEAEMGDVWFEATFEDSEGRAFEFFVKQKAGIIWDGTQLILEGVGVNKGELLVRPLLEAGDNMTRFLDMTAHLGARVVAGEHIRVELRPGTHKLQQWSYKTLRDDPMLAPEGVKVTKREHRDYEFPQLSPKLVKHFYNEPVVAELLGRRWWVEVNTDRRGGKAKVIFETTDEPLTEADPENGRVDQSYWFGQPSFIQGVRLPHLNGKSAYPLQTRETGWGDYGNENVFVTFDEQGIPNGLYVEASCR